MNRIQKWLGIELIYNQVNDLQNYIIGVRGELASLKMLKTEIAVHNKALARMIAKLDPVFGRDELSPKRKAESDKIADDIMNKLLSEHIIAKQAGGDHS